MKKFILTLICCVIVFSLFPKNNFITTYANTKNTEYVVNASILNLREGPGLTYPVVMQLKKNDPLTKIEQKGDWVKVSHNDKVGWVASWLVQSIDKETTALKEVISQVDHLNVRKEPSTSAFVLTQLFTGQKATYIKESGDWIQINYKQQTGWVNKKYVSIVEQNTENEDTSTTAPADTKELNYFTVNVSAVNIRQKPDLSSKKLGTIKLNEQYKVINRDGNWIEIEYAKNKKGWVYSFYGTFTASKLENANSNSNKEDKQFVQIIYNGTNLRKDPSTNAPVVKRANSGESYEIVATSNDWYEIKVNKEKAYVANWVVKLAQEQAQVNTENNTNNTELRKKGTLNGITIVVDPGHGGNDNGTTGVNKTPEKAINLLTAELLTNKLRSAGAEVILTRESDKYVDLRKRVAISNQHNADAFISIHYDAHELSSVHGFTTYYTNSNQKALAQAIHKGISSKISLRDRGVQPGNYLVLRENSKPAVLLELGYLSNRDEERTVNTDYFREQATQGIYNGLINYFDAQLK